MLFQWNASPLPLGLPSVTNPTHVIHSRVWHINRPSESSCEKRKNSQCIILVKYGWPIASQTHSCHTNQSWVSGTSVGYRSHPVSKESRWFKAMNELKGGSRWGCPDVACLIKKTMMLHVIVATKIALSHVTSQKNLCHMSLTILSPMSPVKFKK